jgi:hypothetical protein
MSARAVGVAVCVVAWLVAGAGGAARATDARSSLELYERHCAGCHAGTRPRAAHVSRAPPDLTNLAAAYGSPLPRAYLLHYVLDARRRGGARMCGDHDLWWGDRGHDVALRRRGTVLVVLEHLEAAQQEIRDPSAPHPRAADPPRANP